MRNLMTLSDTFIYNATNTDINESTKNTSNLKIVYLNLYMFKNLVPMKSIQQEPSWLRDD